MWLAIRPIYLRLLHRERVRRPRKYAVVPL
jgi:hypothetical protein